jgi:hypothetical protein
MRLSLHHVLSAAVVLLATGCLQDLVPTNVRATRISGTSSSGGSTGSSGNTSTGSGTGSSGGSAGTPASADFDIMPTSCELQSSLSLSDGSGLTWSSCAVHYDSIAQIYTWQLLTPMSSGTRSEPGPGWITLSFAEASPQNTTLKLASAVMVEPTSLPVGEVALVFTPMNSAARVSGTGTIAVAANSIQTDGSSAQLDATLNVELTTGVTLTGHITAVATGAPSAGSSGTSGAGSSSGSGPSGGNQAPGADGPYPCACAYGGTTAPESKGCSSQGELTCPDDPNVCCPRGTPYHVNGSCYADAHAACESNGGVCPAQCW